MFTSCLNTKSSNKEKLIGMIFQKTYSNSQEFLGELYCYYLYQGVLDSKQITPDLFKNYIKGGTLSLKFLSEYEKWTLEDSEGQMCRKKIGKDFRILSANTGKEFAILLNRKAIIEEGKNPDITLNHELLHVAFAMFKVNRKAVQDKLNELSSKEKEEFISKHPGYDFSKPNILLKEYFSYTYQENIEEGLRLLMK